MKALVLSGVSGSGKSHHARVALEAAGAAGVVVSADAFIVDASGAYAYDWRKLGEAHKACEQAYLDALRARRALVVVDNTNTTLFEVARYVLAARRREYQVEVLTVEALPRDLPELARRNRHAVPLESIRKQFERIRRRVLPASWLARTVPIYRGAVAA